MPVRTRVTSGVLETSHLYIYISLIIHSLFSLQLTLTSISICLFVWIGVKNYETDFKKNILVRLDVAEHRKQCQFN